MERGSRAGYQWLTSDQHCLDDIVRLCPEVLLNRFLAITSTDSGDPKWWAEKLPGWECRGGVGYSPRLDSTAGISCQGFDEWYTFDTAADLGEVIRNENPFSEESLAKPSRLIAFVNLYYSLSSRTTR